MRVLTLSNCDLVESQGSGYVIMNFARGLESLGHQVTLLGSKDCLFGPRTDKARSLRLALGLWRKAGQLVKRIRPDLVEFYGGEAWLATDRLARKPGRRFKIVAHSNGIEPFVHETLARHGVPNTVHGGRLKWYQGRLSFPMERAFARADAVVTVSQPEAEYAIRCEFQPRERVLGIDNALPDHFLGLTFVADRPKTIGFCGSWLARKGIAVLTTDLTTVLREAPDWNLHIVGVGEQFEAAAHFPPDILPRIQITGYLTDKTQLRHIYQSWAIAVMPSVYESFGLVATEAMASGCALVASRTGFAATLRDGDDAMLLMEPRTPHLYVAVKGLIERPALRQRIAHAGWERVQCLNWKSSVRLLENFYLQLLNQAVNRN